MTKRAILSITEGDLSRMKAALQLKVNTLEKEDCGEEEIIPFKILLGKLHQNRLLLKPFRPNPSPSEDFADDGEEGKRGAFIGDDLRYK